MASKKARHAAIRKAVRTVRESGNPYVSRSGGMDTSSITCDCMCHTVYSSLVKRKLNKSTCEHCRVYG